MSKLAQLPTDFRPREKLLRLGAESLTDTELLATILGSGMKGKDVLSLAREVMNALNLSVGKIDSDSLLSIRGIGKAKAIQLLAAQELFRRRIAPHGTTILNPGDVVPKLRSLISRAQEHFFSVTLNGAQELIQIRVIAIGLLNKVEIHPREVFADAITDRAAAIIIAHNHPSQYLDPSPADISVTKALKKGGILLGIKLIDHLIFNENSYFSMRERDVISF